MQRSPLGCGLKVCAIIAALDLLACGSKGHAREGPYVEDPTDPRNPCVDGGCGPASCGDLTLQTNENDIENRDCADSTCAAGDCSSCGDGVKDGNESDVDCGGACGPCAIGQSCSTELDCATGACFGNICLPTPCGNALGLETTRAAAMWGMCPTRLRTSVATISLSAPDAANWSFSTGAAIDSSPAASIDGTIYVGSGDNNLYAIDALGHERWRFPTGGHVSSSPAIRADGTVVFGSDDGKVYALGPDGSLLWSVVTEGAVESSPLIIHAKVLASRNRVTSATRGVRPHAAARRHAQPRRQHYDAAGRKMTKAVTATLNRAVHARATLRTFWDSVSKLVRALEHLLG